MSVTASKVRHMLVVRNAYEILMSNWEKFRRYIARDRSWWLRRPRPLACRDCGFESRWKHGCFLLWMFCVVQVQATVTNRSLVQTSSAECDQVQQ